MCLIAVAHRASDRYPLVIAANRDEEYGRPSLAAHFWEDANVVGGRDALHGGSWLAMTPAGRFAAVTNLRGAVRREEPRSRGELVADFVRSDVNPAEYIAVVSGRLTEYGGFHLLAGVVGGELGLVSGGPAELEPGIHALSNAPPGIRWPKVEVAAEAVRGALESSSAADMVDRLIRLLRTAPAHGDPTHDLFISGELYGTRASTVIVVSDGQVHFVEQSYGRGGVAKDARVTLRFPLL